MASNSLSDIPQYLSPRSVVLAGKLSVPEVFEWHAEENPNLPFFRYFDGTQLHTITSAQVIQAIRHMARYIRSRAGTFPKVIAVIANAGALPLTDSLE